MYWSPIFEQRRREDGNTGMINFNEVLIKDGIRRVLNIPKR